MGTYSDRWLREHTIDEVAPFGPAELERAERVLKAYDRLWHRCVAHDDGDRLTSLLPAPHQLRTGETPRDLLARIDATGTLGDAS